VAPVGLQYEPGFTVTVAAPFGAVVSGAGAAVVAVLPAAGVVAAGAEGVADPYGASATPHGAATVPAQMPFRRLAMNPYSLSSIARPQWDFTTTQFDR